LFGFVGAGLNFNKDQFFYFEIPPKSPRLATGMKAEVYDKSVSFRRSARGGKGESEHFSKEDSKGGYPFGRRAGV